MRPDSTVIVDPAQSQRITISTLNDDCLLEVFAKLSAFDLSAIKRCCRRFRDVADLAARQRYRTETFEYCTSIDHGTTHRGCVVALQDFGEFMYHVCIVMDCFCKNYDRSHYGSPGFAHHNCSGERMLVELQQCTNLNSLTLVCMQLNNVSSRKVSKVLQSLTHLDTLQLIECAGIESNIVRLIKSCKSLKNLTVHAEPVFPWTPCLTDHILKYISKLKTVECISFGALDLQYTFIEHVKELRHLKKLKKLKWDFGGKFHFDLTPAIYALATTDSLEELILIDMVADDEIGRVLDQFIHLKSCVIESYSGIADVFITLANRAERYNGIQ